MSILRNLAAFVRSLRNPVPDHAALCPDFIEPPADYLVPVPIHPAVLAERKAMRAKLFDDLMRQNPNGAAATIFAWEDLTDDRIAAFIGGAK